jgi:cellulose synthase/poly-beta-1,6-N-acetylglucosamine synthase-like glycosyltransferase
LADLDPQSGLRSPRKQGRRFRRVLQRSDRFAVTVIIGLNLAVTAGVLIWATRHLGNAGAGTVISFALLVTVEVVRSTQNLSLWLFAWNASDPQPIEPPGGISVAMLTTFVPSREPIDMLERTLRAMRAVEHRGPLDVWVLDEGDDPAVRELASSLGVRHFSREGRPEYNQPEGAFRSRTKHGNHNAWRAEHERAYDVVAHLDPEHVPRPGFLRRTLGYFADADVAFVVAPHVYANRNDGFVARAAAAHFYPFLGIIQRGGNGLGSPMLIGAAHLYRVTTWQQIGGYQDSITEDHLTGLCAQAHMNP